MKGPIILVCTLLLSFSTVIFAASTGKKVLPTDEMGSETIYPSSGTMSSQSVEVPGVDASSTAPKPQASSVEQERQEETVFETGPYDQEGNYKIDIKEKDSSEPQE